MGVIKEIRSRNFQRNLEEKIMIAKIGSNLEHVARIAGANANTITPLDKGILRNTKRTYRLSTMTFVTEWGDGIGYANMRYYVNKKNPQTTMWAKKDKKKNGAKYLVAVQKDVFK